MCVISERGPDKSIPDNQGYEEILWKLSALATIRVCSSSWVCIKLCDKHSPQFSPTRESPQRPSQVLGWPHNWLCSGSSPWKTCIVFHGDIWSLCSPRPRTSCLFVLPLMWHIAKLLAHRLLSATECRKILYIVTYQSIARQQLGKHLPLVLHDDSGESIVVANVTVRWWAIA
jgi:hypothetical protein